MLCLKYVSKKRIYSSFVESLKICWGEIHMINHQKWIVLWHLVHSRCFANTTYLVSRHCHHSNTQVDFKIPCYAASLQWHPLCVARGLSPGSRPPPRMDTLLTLLRLRHRAWQPSWVDTPLALLRPWYLPWATCHLASPFSHSQLLLQSLPCSVPGDCFSRFVC